MPLTICMNLDSWIQLARRVYYVLTETVVPIVGIVPGVRRAGATVRGLTEQSR
jgi:hypothetical protein